MVVQHTLVGLLLLASASAATVGQAKDGCPDRCGNVSIPYPFGINENCSLNSNFIVTCNTSSNPPKLLLGELSPEGTNIQVVNISLGGELLILSYVSHDCYDSSGEVDHVHSGAYNLWSGWFNISSTRNKFTMVGCDTYAWFKGEFKDQRVKGRYRTGCMSLCDNLRYVQNGSCSGNGCCQTSIPNGLSTINLTLRSFYNYSGIWEFNPCGYAFVVEESYNFSSYDLRDLKGKKKLPMVFDWAFGEETCQVDENSQANYACKGNSRCYKRKTGWGYLCNCLEGYQGNPYLEPGCQDINECESDILNMCENPKTCVNTPGNHTCSCPRWYHGDGRKHGEGCIPNHLQIILAAMAICLSVGFLLLVAGIYWLYQFLKKKKIIQLKKFFKRNGGLLLQQQISSDIGKLEKLKIFSSQELEKAIHYYNENRILGKGGQGIVYKGMLSNGSVVAVKKSKMIDKAQIEHFINEVVILSQINHRHVVKLLGCCLETEVPLLVYEFISNGTLSNHIHDQMEESPMKWSDRLRISKEVAGAIAYMHSAADVPIYHRDIKSSNILLDEKYRAKLSDFGISRSVPTEKSHLTTCVQGTFGYLDPEYFQSRQYTQKSDVYSFGVVLVELLTGQKPISRDRSEDLGLAAHFIASAKENCLFDVLDPQVVIEGEKEEIITLANLAVRCLKLNGRKRPTMKEVSLELENLKRPQRAFAF